ncbi:MAG TPA: GIY-YIG nuclease family protein [Anaerolineae bacterium]|nr:GIY-YIG nuclease family protein [Anaerolineae bacterium]
MRIITEQQEQTWKSALSNVKGVYLIVDTSNGKKYVGSATSEGGIWQRWEDYVNTGHGGNDRLKELMLTYGVTYADNFQYAILEIADSHATKDYILSREAYWKQALLTRQFGYNAN